MFKRVLLLTVVLAAACNRESPSSSGGTPIGTPTPPPANGPRLYVSDEPGGAVAIVDLDAGQVIERIPVGKRPRGLHVSRDGTQLLVAVSGSPIGGPGVDESKLPPPDRSADGIAVVDLATRKLVRTIPSGNDPESFDTSLDGKTLYASNEDASEMTALDLTSGAIRGHVRVGEEPEGVTVRPDGRVVYITCQGDNLVAVIEVATRGVVRTIADGCARPWGIVVSADGQQSSSADGPSGDVSVVDIATGAVDRRIAVGKSPWGVVLAPRK